MHGFFDVLHLWGISIILDIQLMFQDYSGIMMMLSYIADPKVAFTFYFPVTYFLHTSTGKRVIWVTVIAEWLNALTKWLLHGERPYWWVHESGLYKPSDVPQLEQYEITCETGPGSPSGHTMITGAVWYILVSDFMYYTKMTSISSRAICWTIYLAALNSVALSRLFVATHFPHQVLIGILAGILVGMLLDSVPVTNLKLPHYCLVAFALTFMAVAVQSVISYLTNDPLWSLVYAARWCEHKEWVHMDTTIFYSLIRDISSLMSLGVGVWLSPDQDLLPNSSFSKKCVAIVVALAVTTFSNGLRASQENVLLFYVVGFIKHFLTVFMVVVGVPKLVNTLKKILLT